MRVLTEELNKRRIDCTKLKEANFIKKDNSYLFEKDILDNSFKVIIILEEDTLKTKIIDKSTNEEYIMADLKYTTGSYVTKVKEEYEKPIRELIDKITYIDTFKNTNTKRIIKYINKKYKDDLEYVFKNDFGSAICRNKRNNKWYALFLTVKENRLIGEDNKLIEILNLKYYKDKTDEVIDKKIIFKAYHMNKRSWISIKLDEVKDLSLIYNLIDISYQLVDEK